MSLQLWCQTNNKKRAQDNIFYPPASEVSRGVYWNQTQKNKISPTGVLSTLGCLWLCDSVTLWLISGSPWTMHYAMITFFCISIEQLTIGFYIGPVLNGPILTLWIILTIQGSNAFGQLSPRSFNFLLTFRDISSN